MIFDDNTLGINLLNPSFGLLHSDPFDNVTDIGSTIPSFGILTNQSTFVPKLIGS
jgi:hypothetical protein